MLLGGEKDSCTGRSLSTHNEAKTKRALKPNQKIIPIGIAIILSLLLVVAIRYTNSAYLSAKLIVSLFTAA